jgi:hypothetical protein
MNKKLLIGTIVGTVLALGVWFVVDKFSEVGVTLGKEKKHLHAECEINSSDKECEDGLVCTPFNEQSGNAKCEYPEVTPTTKVCRPTVTPTVELTVTPTVATPSATLTPTSEPTLTLTPSPEPTSTQGVSEQKWEGIRKVEGPVYGANK